MPYKRYPKRDPLKNRFTLPNEIHSLNLCSHEIAIYAYLLYCEDRKTYQAYPSYNTIGAAVQLSKNTVRKYVSQLEQKKFITTEPTKVLAKDGNYRNGNLLYTIRPIQEAIDFYHAEQIRKADETIRKQQIQEQLANATNAKRAMSSTTPSLQTNNLTSSTANHLAPNENHWDTGTDTDVLNQDDYADEFFDFDIA
ncbi:MAG: helix-turn-helix domain-containing protein [Faecalibacterium sp.]